MTIWFEVKAADSNAIWIRQKWEKEMGKNFEEPTEGLTSLPLFFFFQDNTMTALKS